MISVQNIHTYNGPGVAQRLCNGLLRNDRSSIPGGDGVKTKLHVLRKGQ